MGLEVVNVRDRASQVQAVKDVLTLCRALIPPARIVHVGAGMGSDVPMYLELSVEMVELLEADHSNVRALEKSTLELPNFAVHHRLVGPASEQVEFHYFGNPRENGLMPAEQLRPLWRNLHRERSETMQAVTLDEVVIGRTDSERIWLVIDCLPSARILSGALDMLGSCDLVLARVSMREGSTTGDSLPEVQALLEGQDFGLYKTFEERMPLVGRALFVRNIAKASSAYREQFKSLSAQNEKLEQQNLSLTAEHRQLHCDFDDLARQYDSSQSGMGSLQKSLDRLNGEVGELQQSIELRTSELDLVEREVLSLRSENSSLRQDLLDSSEDRKSQAQECLNLRAEIVGRQQAETELISQLQAKAEQEAVLDGALQDAIARYDTALGEANMLRASLSQVATDIVLLRDANSVLSEYREGAESELRLIREQLDLARESQTKLHMERDQLRLECGELTQQVVEHKAELAELGNLASEENLLAHMRLDCLRQAEELELDRVAEISALRGQIEIANDRLAESEASRVLLEDELEQCGVRLHEAELALTSWPERFESECSRLSAQLAGRDKELAEVNAGLMEAEHRVADLVTKLASERTRAEEVQADYAALQNLRDQLTKEIARVEAQIELMTNILVRQDRRER